MEWDLVSTNLQTILKKKGNETLADRQNIMKDLYYFFIKNGNQKELQGVFLVDNLLVKHINISNIKNSGTNKWFVKESLVECELKEGEKLVDGIFRRGKIYSKSKMLKDYSLIEKVVSIPGIYFPRIYRPIFTDRYFSKTFLYDKYRIDQLENEVWNYRDFLPYDENYFVSGINQLSILVESLNEIFKTIHPCVENMKAFGQNIRNLLILSCTEVEAQLKGILKENSLIQKKNYTTNDFVKLKSVLKLDNYSIKLGYYPWLNEFKPFENWVKTSPTKSLPWYDNYNSVKHDREKEFSKGSLKSVIDAVSAVAILMIAQYGEKLPYWKEQLGGYFELIEKPNWDFDEEYFPPYSGTEWQRKKMFK